MEDGLTLFINRADPPEKAYLLKPFAFKILVLVGRDVFLLRPVEERKRADEGGYCAPDIQESSCRETSVFATGSSRNASFCDEARLSGRIGRVLASVWSFDQIGLVWSWGSVSLFPDSV